MFQLKQVMSIRSQPTHCKKYQQQRQLFSLLGLTEAKKKKTTTRRFFKLATFLLRKHTLPLRAIHVLD